MRGVVWLNAWRGVVERGVARGVAVCACVLDWGVAREVRRT